MVTQSRSDDRCVSPRQPRPPVKIAYVTPCSPLDTSGGVSAVSAHTWQQISRRFPTASQHAIRPARTWIGRQRSRVVRRVLGRPGYFDLFSANNLAANAKAVDDRLDDDVDAVVFKGATPWMGWRPSRPYFVYMDVCFLEYFHHTFSTRQFHQRDVERISRQEAGWLEGATAVFFESQWGAQQTQQKYGLSARNFVPVGLGGHVPVPAADVYRHDSRVLVSIARNYRQKGGDIIRDAFAALAPRYPELEWHIIGGRPDEPWANVKGMVYRGFLSKTNPAELAEFRSVLAQAFLLIHPTREDVNPLVISEAAYFGCPCISVNQFAIPEMVRHGETGLLLDFPAKAGPLADAIESLIREPAIYRNMRRDARTFALKQASWDVIGERMCTRIAASFGDVPSATPDAR